jgi:hypothetical protein
MDYDAGQYSYDRAAQNIPGPMHAYKNSGYAHNKRCTHEIPPPALVYEKYGGSESEKKCHMPGWKRIAGFRYERSEMVKIHRPEMRIEAADYGGYDSTRENYTQGAFANLKQAAAGVFGHKKESYHGRAQQIREIMRQENHKTVQKEAFVR